MTNPLPLSINTADHSEWPKMWHSETVAAETFPTGRVCSHVTVTIGGREDGAGWGVATAAPDCSTVLSIYNDGPLCHSHNRKVDVTEMNGATV